MVIIHENLADMTDIREFLGRVRVSREPLNETCADDTCGNSDGANPEEGKNDGQYRACDRNRIYITITDCEYRGDAPPET